MEPVNDHDSEHFPIRVVSQRTGVNTVTLRAWERRYGLLRPVRTAKGHRLYSAADIARVGRIVGWINRGVSIGQVRALLARSEAANADEVVAVEPGDWPDYGARVVRAVSQFDEHRLDDVVNEALALYPFATVCERLLHPLGQNLAGRWQGGPGDRAEQAFVEGYLKRKLAARVQAGSRHLAGAPVLVTGLPGGANHLSLLILAVGFHALEVPVVLLPASLPVADILIACDRRPPAVIVLHADTAQEPMVLARVLGQLSSLDDVPVCVAGAAARIHEQLILDAGALPLVDESLAVAARRVAPLLEGSACE